MLNDSFVGQIGLVMGIAVGVIALGFALISLGASMSFDLDLFLYANNVTNMNMDIQKDLENKANFADMYTIEGIIALTGGIALLIMAYLKYRKIIKKK